MLRNAGLTSWRHALRFTCSHVDFTQEAPLCVTLTVFPVVALVIVFYAVLSAVSVGLPAAPFGIRSQAAFVQAFVQIGQGALNLHVILPYPEIVVRPASE